MPENTISAEESLERLVSAASFEADDPETRDGGIGTLGEKTLHAALKNYYEPDPRLHEIRYKGCVADIMRDGEIIEIQTANFYGMRSKLERFCAENRVTVVYPAARRKTIVTVDPKTGEALSRRRSPKTGSPYEIYAELIHILAFLREPNLSFRVVMVDLDEYRVTADKKRRGRGKAYTRTERIPTAFCEEYEAGGGAGWTSLIPGEILSADYFTIKDFAKYSSLTYYRASAAVKVLLTAGAVEKIARPEAEKPPKTKKNAPEAERSAAKAADKSRSRNFYRVMPVSK